MFRRQVRYIGLRIVRNQEMDVLQELAISGILRFGNSRERISTGADVRIVHLKAVSGIGETAKIKEFSFDYRTITEVGKRKSELPIRVNLEKLG